MKLFAYLPPLVFLIACGSSSESTVASDAGEDASSFDAQVDAHVDAIGDDVVALDGAKTDGGGDGAPASDTAAPPSDAAVDASALEPHPPAAATLCASGTLTQADARAACAAPAFALDDIVNPDGSHTSIERHCDAITFDHAEWRAYCSPSGVYLWARYDGVKPSGTFKSCSSLGGGTSDLEVGLMWWDAAAGSGGRGGSGIAQGVPNYFFGEGMPTSIVLSTQIDDTSYVKGSGQLFVGAHHAVECGADGKPTGMPGKDVVVSGAALVWPKS